MVHQLRISINEFEPEIWRSFKIDSNASFKDLHHVIQIVMGWNDCHLYEFENKNFTIGPSPEDDSYDFEDIIPSDSITVTEVLTRKRSKIQYIYDFGDWWEHTIVVEAIFKDEILEHPVCFAGEMSCPPEDCGGIWGYEELLDIIKDKENPDHEESLEWLGEDFDSKKFDIESINKLFKPKTKKTNSKIIKLWK